ncbi:unnamed protein product [Rhizophagus irregularis]|uniref:Uncharacterized protein n=1 Tax=Rhizophagus irregularis TaxID=588596 RepID=A0A916E2D2_9GLOM|nr:unnamed protein product [Rhizophagus irregularis]
MENGESAQKIISMMGLQGNLSSYAIKHGIIPPSESRFEIKLQPTQSICKNGQKEKEESTLRKGRIYLTMDSFNNTTSFHFKVQKDSGYEEQLHLIHQM